MTIMALMVIYTSLWIIALVAVMLLLVAQTILFLQSRPHPPTRIKPPG